MESCTEQLQRSQFAVRDSILWRKFVSKQTISAGFIVLACGDVVALSQFNLNLWEAVAFGVLCITSYGMGLWSGLAE